MKDELTKAVSRNILNNVFSLLNTLYINLGGISNCLTLFMKVLKVEKS